MNVVHIPDSQVISENGKEYTVSGTFISISSSLLALVTFVR